MSTPHILTALAFLALVIVIIVQDINRMAADAENERLAARNACLKEQLKAINAVCARYEGRTVDETFWRGAEK